MWECHFILRITPFCFVFVVRLHCSKQNLMQIQVLFLFFGFHYFDMSNISNTPLIIFNVWDTDIRQNRVKNTGHNLLNDTLLIKGRCIKTKRYVMQYIWNRFKARLCKISSEQTARNTFVAENFIKANEVWPWGLTLSSPYFRHHCQA